MGYVPHILHSVCILGETARAWGVVYGGAEDTSSKGEPETCRQATKRVSVKRYSSTL